MRRETPFNVPLQGTGIANGLVPAVMISPYSPCIMPSQTMQFSVLFSGTASANVLWYVDNVLSGNADSGTISSSGLYTAPSTAANHVVSAVSQGTTRYSGSTTLTVSAAPQFGIYPYVAAIPPKGQQAFQAQLCGVPDQGPVSYTVDNVAGGNATVGTVTNDGVYTAPAGAGKHTVRVTDAAVGKTSGSVVTVFSCLTADYGSGTDSSHPIAADMFRNRSRRHVNALDDGRPDSDYPGWPDDNLSSVCANSALVYATQTPDWTKIDPDDRFNQGCWTATHDSNVDDPDMAAAES